MTKQVSTPRLDEYHVGFAINCDQKELEGALLRILNDEKLRLTMGENARKFAGETASLTIAIDRFEEGFHAIEKRSSENS